MMTDEKQQPTTQQIKKIIIGLYNEEEVDTNIFHAVD
jgi:hypothetical protein